MDCFVTQILDQLSGTVSSFFDLETFPSHRLSCSAQDRQYHSGFHIDKQGRTRSLPLLKWSHSLSTFNRVGATVPGSTPTAQTTSAPHYCSRQTLTLQAKQHAASVRPRDHMNPPKILHNTLSGEQKRPHKFSQLVTAQSACHTETPAVTETELN